MNVKKKKKWFPVSALWPLRWLSPAMAGFYEPPWLGYSPSFFNQTLIHVLLWKSADFKGGHSGWPGWAWFNQPKGLRSRSETPEKIPLWTAASARVWESLPALPDGLPCGFQTCVTSLHNHICPCLTVNPLIYISYWFGFSGWTLNRTPPLGKQMGGTVYAATFK